LLKPDYPNGEVKLYDQEKIARRCWKLSSRSESAPLKQDAKVGRQAVEISKIILIERSRQVGKEG
jgi:hypothetical protein